ncbi:MAG: asparagine synthase (glutamine-hydrolyzing) [Lysobacterales bacterium]
MCGFTGFINLSGLPGLPTDRRVVLDDMLSRIAHRGPDDAVLNDDGVLALGFCRLSIVDVTGGQQPFWNEDRSVLAVVNGEIYNHLDLKAQLQKSFNFGSRSDSEVILPLYKDRGSNMFDDVNGIFAVAIWDAPERRLVLARDRLGVKPLYYTLTGDTLLFASELKALLAHPGCPRELNWRQVQLSTTIHQPVTPSFIKGVHQLPAGHMLIFEPGRAVRPFPYWSINNHFPNPGEKPQHSSRYYVERYSELFDDSVRMQLMSDVPLGLFLSGGIDSSLIATAASGHQPGMDCFTIAEKTTAMTGDLGQARKVTDELSLPLHCVSYNGPAMLDELHFDLEYLEYMVWCVDAPRFNLEWFFKHELYRYAKTRFPDLKVILTGAGADEFAGGYSNSYTAPNRSWQDYVLNNVQPRWEVFRALEDEESEKAGLESSLAQERSRRSGYQHMMYMNALSLQFYNLWYEDRTSAAHGIEARVPFLDHRLVELQASVPPAYHEELFWKKQIVRKQLGRLMPWYPADFPKVPFVFVPGNDSVKSVRTLILKRTFRPFLEKYVKPGDPHLPGLPLEKLFQIATSGSRDAHRAESKLLHIMQTAIFRDNCLDGWRDPPSIPTASPLQAQA